MADTLYNPNNSGLRIDGIVQSDFAPGGDMWTLTKQDPFANIEADAQGNTVTTINGSEIYNLTINYNETSSDLGRVLNKAENREQFTVTFTDRNDLSIAKASGERAIVTEHDGYKRGNGVPVMSVTFMIPRINKQFNTD